MMAQYLEIKAEHPNALLFYRMGDFYELFFNDADQAAAALDIALTKRGKHLGKDIAMCGVPVHSAEGYLQTLIRKGFRVAVCEQLEDPIEAKKRGSKSVVKRGVVRLITPGTLTEDALLEARRHNYLAAISEIRGEAAIAWVDISTGELRVLAIPTERFSFEMARLRPSEVLVAESPSDVIAELVTESGASLTPLSSASFDSQAATNRLKSHFGVDTMDGFGAFSRAEISALGAIVDYLDLTQRGKLPLLRAPIREVCGASMQIDAATRRNLELVQSLSGGKSGTLLSVIDKTVTAGGGRLLERRLSSPSGDLNVIVSTQDAVEYFVNEPELNKLLRHALKRVPDMDRALSRLALDRGGPRDLAAIRNTLAQAGEIYQHISDKMPDLVTELSRKLVGFSDLIELLSGTMVEEPPILVRDGGFVAANYSEELDEARRLRDEGRGVIAGYQADYANYTGIPTLKIKHNNVLGYFVETTATHADRMLSEPLSEKFIHRQTIANAVRFTTVELSSIETKIHNARARALELEKAAFEDLRSEVLKCSMTLGSAANALAEFDVLLGHAANARSHGWCRPIVDQSRAFDITAGRHPVVENSLQENGQPFIANDCDLGGSENGSIWLLTGPNMAGKSTFLRQNALIAILAQMGGFVPALAAHIGLVTHLFSRVGASDDLARGRSTFMVEMVETATILNQADDRSLVILDEIGRGTATYDGLSIAWAALEHLHDANQCRALFATHYHEMTQLDGRLSGVQNATVAVKEWEGDVVFLHEVRKGAADRSYGVQVAKLAGLPLVVIERAKVILEALEKGEREGSTRQKTLIDDLPLFAAIPVTPAIQSKSSIIEAKLAEIYPDNLTPRQALQILYELKESLKSP
ncbi:MAG: DNA mismatch repair protein MutS [Boseongicola sp.]|nr:MAG: DNA mismatch repair protein MutS [Boseongicola sp.]